MTLTPNISSGTLEELADSCVAFYKMNRGKMSTDTVRKKRAQLSRHVETFHRDCGTLTAPVQRRIQELRDGNCIVLMIAHQPNFFGYSGVFRKATLNLVLSDMLEKRLKLPVVCFFGIADQDFTDDRWVRSALLPDVQRRDGLFSLNVSLPRKLLLNSVPKSSQEAFNRWRSAVDEWFSSKACPDVPGLVAEGRTLTETAEIAQDVARKILDRSCVEHGDPLPPAFRKRRTRAQALTVPVGLPAQR